MIVVARNKETLKEKVNKSVRRVRRQMEENRLAVALEKTESVPLVGRKKLQSLEIQIRKATLQTTESLKYLRVHFQRNLQTAVHINSIEKNPVNFSESYCLQWCTLSCYMKCKREFGALIAR